MSIDKKRVSKILNEVNSQNSCHNINITLLDKTAFKAAASWPNHSNLHTLYPLDQFGKSNWASRRKDHLKTLAIEQGFSYELPPDSWVSNFLCTRLGIDLHRYSQWYTSLDLAVWVDNDLIILCRGTIIYGERKLEIAIDDYARPPTSIPNVALKKVMWVYEQLCCHMVTNIKIYPKDHLKSFYINTLGFIPSSDHGLVKTL